MIRGKVVLVPFPFDDFSGTKVRPTVCLTDPHFFSLDYNTKFKLK